MFKKVFPILISALFLAACVAPQNVTNPAAPAAVEPQAEAVAAAPAAATEPVVTASDAAEAAIPTPESPVRVTTVVENSTVALPSGLTQAEADGLLWMREEEKLARDVYQALSAQWGLPVFENIIASEQAHMDSILALLNQYGIADPANSEAGVFTNPDLQALYDQLVATGSQSLADAIQMGGAIEEIDILDLQKHLATVQQDAIRLVYENLVMGSENHLRAFANTLEKQTGAVYQPQYLGAEAFQAIYDGTMGRGGQGGGGGGTGGGQNRQGQP